MAEKKDGRENDRKMTELAKARSGKNRKLKEAKSTREFNDLWYDYMHTNMTKQ